MEFFSTIISSLAYLTGLLTLSALLAITGGLAMGIAIGAIPGINGAMGVALLIPLTFVMDPQVAIPMLAALYIGAQFGGAIPAILLNTPGTGSAAATTFDGYPMAQKGQAGKALGVALISSAAGGLVGVIILWSFTPQLASLAIHFGPAQYFGLTVLALSVVTSVSSASLTKGLIATGMGLFLATIGLDQISGDARYTFGFAELRDRIHFVPVLIGMYAFAEVFRNAATIREKAAQDFSQATRLPSFRELGLIKWVILRSAMIGSVLGSLPGAGATMASFVSYNETVRFSRHPEKMGKGQPEGVAASEAADNSAACGAFIPLLALGIPGSATTAIIMAAFHVHGLRPGPMLFSTSPDLVNVIFLSLLVGNFIMIALGLLGAKVFSRIIQIPYSILGPAILVMGAVGSYAIRRNILDLWVVLIFGIVGYIFDRQKIPKAPFILALILGPLVEENLRRALLIAAGDFVAMASDPFTALLLFLAVVSFLVPLITSFFKSRRAGSGS